MDCLKALKFPLGVNPSIHGWCRRSLFMPVPYSSLIGHSQITQKKIKHHSRSPFCTSYCSTGHDVQMTNGPSRPRGVGEVVKFEEAPSHSKFLQVVLVSPQIPGNAGCIARTCAASAVGLHLVEPLGFKIDDTRLKRAGLDYWPYVVVKVHRSWSDFQDYFRNLDGDKRLLAFTKRGTEVHSEFSYRQGDWLVFGSETSGLPPEALSDCKDKLKIPMVQTYVRCLNLSVSVGIAVYEASRQLDYRQIASEPSLDSGQSSFLTEDIFA